MEILKANDEKAIEKAKEMLLAGKVFIFPTDTVYGILADANNNKAVEKVFAIKKRPRNKPLPFFVADIYEAEKIVKISEKQKMFLNKVWPGKVTVILEKKGGNGTLALRIPNYPLLNMILRETKMVLTGTSANISGQPAGNNLKEILKQFKELKPDAVFDAGILPISKPSTIVDLTSPIFKILRQGAVKLKEAHHE